MLSAFSAVGFTFSATDDRIEKRVDSRIRSTVAAIYDSLDREGIKADPMVLYAIEGTVKGGRPDVILAGVRKWAGDLRRSRSLLGPEATDNEVSAGAKALRAGIDERQLTRLRESRSQQRYASALNTIAYVVTLGVPADTAATILVNLALASATDAQLHSLQADIERDIGAGTPAGAAAIARAVGVLKEIEAGAAADGVTPGAALPSSRGTRPADPMANPTLRGTAVGSQGDGRPPAPRGKDNKRP
jgi:hypothetical protein